MATKIQVRRGTASLDYFAGQSAFNQRYVYYQNGVSSALPATATPVAGPQLMPVINFKTA